MKRLKELSYDEILDAPVEVLKLRHQITLGIRISKSFHEKLIEEYPNYFMEVEPKEIID